jgi:hypothetical protein
MFGKKKKEEAERKMAADEMISWLEQVKAARTPGSEVFTDEILDRAGAPPLPPSGSTMTSVINRKSAVYFVVEIAARYPRAERIRENGEAALANYWDDVSQWLKTLA